MSGYYAKVTSFPPSKKQKVAELHEAQEIPKPKDLVTSHQPEWQEDELPGKGQEMDEDADSLAGSEEGSEDSVTEEILATLGELRVSIQDLAAKVVVCLEALGKDQNSSTSTSTKRRGK